jgi:hypothetical protein
MRIENAQRQRYLSLIYVHKVGGLNEKRCKKVKNISFSKIFCSTFLKSGFIKK